MFYFSIVLLVILGFIFLANLYLLTKDKLWNRRLTQYQESEGVDVTTKDRPQRFERTLSATLALILMLIITPTMLLQKSTETVNENYIKRHVEAKTVSSHYQLDQLFKSGNTRKDDFMNEPGTVTEEESIGKTIDTNEQVKGVKEADIIKTNGKFIYYAPRRSEVHMSTLNMILVSDDGIASLYKQIHYDDFYIDEFFLTESFIVLIGQQNHPYTPQDDVMGFASHHYMDFTGAIRILDVNTLDEVYSLNTKGYIITYRLIDNVLYLFQMSYRFEGSEPRMTFDIKQGHMTYQKQIDIGDILFFNESAHFSLNYITSINLTNFHIQSKAFLGNIEHIYVSQNSAYIAISDQFTYKYDEIIDTFDYTIKTRIVKYDLQKDGHIHYRASVVVNGRIINPYAMDEYDGMFRVVTTVLNKKDNRLYIFKESKETDEFIQIGYLTEGIGKENESVKSVRFNEDRVNIVTFYQTDPNYTIDLKDPTNPTIIGIVEEPGYSTYMHPWGENRLIGLGYDAFDGRVTRIKLSAYSSLEDSPLETYFFDSSSYYYAAALYDPRMIMVDKDLGIFAFLVTGYSKISDNRNENTSNYYIFKIDFDQSPIIQKPFVLESDLYSSKAIERAVYINGIIYTLSYDELRAVRVVDFEIIQILNLNA